MAQVMMRLRQIVPAKRLVPSHRVISLEQFDPKKLSMTVPMQHYVYNGTGAKYTSMNLIYGSPEEGLTHDWVLELPLFSFYGLEPVYHWEHGPEGNYEIMHYQVPIKNTSMEQLKQFKLLEQILHQIQHRVSEFLLQPPYATAFRIRSENDLNCHLKPIFRYRCDPVSGEICMDRPFYIWFKAKPSTTVFLDHITNDIIQPDQLAAWNLGNDYSRIKKYPKKTYVIHNGLLQINWIHVADSKISIQKHFLQGYVQHKTT